MVAFIITILVTTISLIIISRIPPVGVEIDNPFKALIGGVIIGAFSGLGGLFPGWFRTGTAILSLGLIPLISGVIIFGLAAWLVEGFRLRHGIWSAILGAILLSIINSILFWLLRSVGLVTF